MLGVFFVLVLSQRLAMCLRTPGFAVGRADARARVPPVLSFPLEGVRLRRGVGQQ